jgi:hypothetical protein
MRALGCPTCQVPPWLYFGGASLLDHESGDRWNPGRDARVLSQAADGLRVSRVGRTVIPQRFESHGHTYLAREGGDPGGLWYDLHTEQPSRSVAGLYGLTTMPTEVCGRGTGHRKSKGGLLEIG